MAAGAGQAPGRHGGASDDMTSSTTTGPLLEVRGLGVTFVRDGRASAAVRDVSLSVSRGERVALVGESGCGKSMTCLALTRLPPTDRAAVTGDVRFKGAPLRSAGRGVSYVFQDPVASLDPVMRIGAQLEEAFPRERRPGPGRAVRDAMVALLGQVDLPSPGALLRAYPCELSGGMCQRVMIAMALAAGPDLLVADEPTTALDVTTQADVMDLVERIARERGMALLLATHNLGLVSGRCDSICVLYAGEVVETGPVDRVLASPRHPYTRGLLRAVPRIEEGRANRLRDIPGTVPSAEALARMTGCAFRPRCPCATAACGGTIPVRDGVRCVLGGAPPP